MPTQPQPCAFNDIVQINKNKEFTLIATQLLENLLTDKRLNAQTTKLWQLLFNKVRFNNNLEIKISYNCLANKLGRSSRTISRYIDTLVNTGYLTIKHNYDKSGAQQENTILVRIPMFHVEQISKKRDRYKTPSLPINEKGIVNGCKESKNYNNTVELLVSETKEASLTTVAENSENKSTNDKFDRGGYVISDIQKDSNNKIKHNNNTVVFSVNCDKDEITNLTSFEQVSLKTKEKIKQLIQEKKRLEELDKNEGYKLPNLASDQEATIKHLEYLGSLRDTINFLAMQIEKLEKEIVATTEKEAKETILKTQIDYMLKKSGKIQLTTFTFKRLVKTLESLGYSDNILIWLVNEIVFEVRFGSLMTCSKTGQALSSEHAVNIALKLVREKRWASPILLIKAMGMA